MLKMSLFEYSHSYGYIITHGSVSLKNDRSVNIFPSFKTQFLWEDHDQWL